MSARAAWRCWSTQCVSCNQGSAKQVRRAQACLVICLVHAQTDWKLRPHHCVMAPQRQVDCSMLIILCTLPSCLSPRIHDADRTDLCP